MDHLFSKENNQTCSNTDIFLQNVLAHVAHSFHKQFFKHYQSHLVSPKCRSTWITIFNFHQDDLHILEDDLKAMEDYLFPWKMTSPSISKSKLLGMSHKMTLHFDFKHLKLVQKSILSLKIGAIFHFKNLNSVAKLILKALKWAANLILNLKPFKILKPYGDPCYSPVSAAMLTTKS